MAKLSAEDRKSIKSDLASGKTVSATAEKFQVSRAAIRNAVADGALVNEHEEAAYHRLRHAMHNVKAGGDFRSRLSILDVQQVMFAFRRIGNLVDKDI